MYTMNRIQSVLKPAAIVIATLIFASNSANAATVELTSVDQLDLTNVVKAYDFTGSNSIASDGTSFDIGGVTFTRHRWNDAVSSGGNVAVTAGSLTLRLAEGTAPGGDNRRLISGLIINAVPVPAPAALPAGLALLGLAAMRRRMK